MKSYNEYGDDLVDLETAIILDSISLDKYSPECFIIEEGVRKEDATIIDAWTGIVPDGFRFLCYRPTVSFVQRLLRENYDIHVFIGWRPNVEKWDSHAYSLELSPKDYIKKRDLKSYKEDELYDSYDEALREGVKKGLNSILE